MIRAVGKLMRIGVPPDLIPQIVGAAIAIGPVLLGAPARLVGAHPPQVMDDAPDQQEHEAAAKDIDHYKAP
jgi:hypothetical protein